jgi:ATP-dependent DNA ligase
VNLIARREGERVILRTRGGYNWAERYPRIVAAVMALRVKSIVIDGEVAVQGPCRGKRLFGVTAGWL